MAMQQYKNYKEGDSMSDLISDNYSILLVLSRFGISLGFGEKSVGQVCRDNGVDTGTFLSIANMMTGGEETGGGVSAGSLITYLRRSHSYFLDFRLPGIRADLVAVVGTSDSLSRAIVSYFDEYVDEVRQHMMYEEETVFPYVGSLLAGDRKKDYSIGVFRKRHDQVEAKLTEFKNILIKYYPARSSNEINSILFDIFNCEKDLASHTAIEDRLFVPAIIELEKGGGKP
jgi:regulator of cell morphogenesis and NO signaling